MKAEDLGLLELLDLNPDEGTIQLQNRRMLLIEADALGILREELIAALGEAAARSILTRFGYVCGYEDALASRVLFRAKGDHECREWWQAGPRLHALEGIVKATRVKWCVDQPRRHFYSEVAWENSYEAEQHLLRRGPAVRPVCWTLVGYASGYATACFGSEVYHQEVECRAEGDARCYIVGRTKEAWGKDQLDGFGRFQTADLRKVLDRLRADLTRKRRELEEQRREVRRLREDLLRRGRIGGLVYDSKQMRETVNLVLRVAGGDSSVLLTGESGTGKELLARLIHDRSPRMKGPFIAVNCGALPESLLESEMFGHARGAFTGAVRDRVGLFRRAELGTLFLDEVSTMSPALQAKLLRAIQEREIIPVGSEIPVRVNVRIVAATNRDLHQMVEAGQFRKDLFYRLNVIAVSLPPLRARRDDIVPLVRLFLQEHCHVCHRPIPLLSPAALDLLLAYEWPGNVRELKNVIERLVLFCSGGRIDVVDLPEEIRFRSAVRSLNALPEGAPLAEVERVHVLRALQKNQGNQIKTARELGISYPTLWRRLRRYRTLSIS